MPAIWQKWSPWHELYGELAAVTGINGSVERGLTCIPIWLKAAIEQHRLRKSKVTGDGTAGVGKD